MSSNDTGHGLYFVVGAGRSGSTQFFEMLCKHSAVYYLSDLAAKFPTNPFLNRFRTGRVIRHVMPKNMRPSEAYDWWAQVFGGFGNPSRDLTDVDAADFIKDKFSDKCLGLGIKRSHRPLVFKITGWPRALFLNKMFPQAGFIEIRRDVLATAFSLYNVRFWDGWRGPGCWRKGPLDDEILKIWRKHGECFLVLAAIEVLIVLRAVKNARRVIPDARWLTIDYEELVAEPLRVFKCVSEFLNIDFNLFKKQAPTWRLNNANNKVAQQLGPSAVTRVNTAIHEVQNSAWFNNLD